MVPIAPPLAVAALALFLAACGTAFDRPRPAAVAHLDIVRQQNYIVATKATLKNFRTAARDLHSRNRPVSLHELADRFDRFVKLQVAPVVTDLETGNNLATRLEIAKLQLLCAVTYAELSDLGKARELLNDMRKRYEGNTSILEAPLDYDDIGVASLGAGLQLLAGQIASPLPSPLAANRSAQHRVDSRKDVPWSRTPSTPLPMRSSGP